jgi:DNA-binding NtrC family response regulator
MHTTTNILVVDDDPVVRKALRRLLEMDGHSVKTCGTGTVGLDEAKTGEYRIAFVDLKMPGIDGMETLRRIKQIDPYIVSIVITGYATIESSVTAMRLGASDYLCKPFDLDELKLVVHRTLESSALAQSRSEVLVIGQEMGMITSLDPAKGFEVIGSGVMAHLYDNFWISLQESSTSRSPLWLNPGRFLPMVWCGPSISAMT